MTRAFICPDCKRHIQRSADQYDVRVEFVSKDRRSRLRAIQVGVTCKDCVQGQANRLQLMRDEQTLKAYDVIAEKFGHPELLEISE